MLNIQTNQICFARWRNGYYYPAVIGTIFHDRIRVGYLDGTSGVVSEEDIISLQEAFKTMEFQGRWREGAIFYKGNLSTHLSPMVMNYDDGDVEQIELWQLRGKIVYKDLRHQNSDRRN